MNRLVLALSMMPLFAKNASGFGGGLVSRRPRGTPRVRAAAVAAGLVVAAIAVLGASGVARADNLCGATITQDFVLQQDLACIADGLIAGADGITIQLNGHTIAGSGMNPNSAGIRAEGRSGLALEGPGTLKGFTAGVLIANSTNASVTDLSAVGNGLMLMRMDPAGAGIRVVNSSSVVIAENTASGNQNAAIFLGKGSTNVRVVENVAIGGGHDAIQLRNSHGNVIEENSASAPAPPGCGVLLIASNDNVVRENTLTGAGAAGVLLVAGSTGNEVRENLLVGNSNGLRAFGGSTANVFAENTIVANVNGISFVGGTPPPPPALGNIFLENLVAQNSCGITGTPTAVAGNTFVDNEFESNGQDICLVA